MILIIIILNIVFLLSLIFFAICLSNLEIDVENFEYNSGNIEQKKLEDYLIYIRLKLLKKITWVKLIIDDDRVKKIKDSKILKIEILKRILLKNEKQIFTIGNLKHIQRLEINRLNLKMKIDVIDTIITAFAVALISTLVSITLSKNIKNYKNENYTYKIEPIYNESVQIIISLNCIINVKMVHIINILYMLLKKRSVVYDERTPNRGAYVCSDE